MGSEDDIVETYPFLYFTFVGLIVIAQEKVLVYRKYTLIFGMVGNTLTIFSEMACGKESPL